MINADEVVISSSSSYSNSHNFIQWSCFDLKNKAAALQRKIKQVYETWKCVLILSGHILILLIFLIVLELQKNFSVKLQI